MNLVTMSQPELIEIFKDSIESQELRSKSMAASLHGDIFPLLYLSLNNKFKIAVENDAKFINEGQAENREMLEEVMNRLREIYSDLYPAHLNGLGLIKSLDYRSRTFAEKSSVPINFQDFTSVDKSLYPENKLLHIFNLYSSTLEYLLSNPTTEIDVLLYNTGSVLNIEFISNLENSTTTEEEIKSQKVDAKLKNIFSRLLILKAHVNDSSTWPKLLKVAIPI